MFYLGTNTQIVYILSLQFIGVSCVCFPNLNKEKCEEIWYMIKIYLVKGYLTHWIV